MASPYPSGDAPSYASHRMSQQLDPSAPPPPPKPSSEEMSRQSTPGLPASINPYSQSPPLPLEKRPSPSTPINSQTQTTPQQPRQAPETEDPGPNWLPKILQDKSKQDLEDILSSPALLAALAHNPSTAHPSTIASFDHVQTALDANIQLSSHVSDYAKQLERQRTQVQAQLLSTHALERQWRLKQSEMDRALGPFSPGALYQRIGQSVQEQENVTRAMEESFMDGGAGSGGYGEGGKANEREVGEWVRKYREERKRYWERKSRKERWDEGRVGGWR